VDDSSFWIHRRLAVTIDEKLNYFTGRLNETERTSMRWWFRATARRLGGHRALYMTDVSRIYYRFYNFNDPILVFTFDELLAELAHGRPPVAFPAQISEDDDYYLDTFDDLTSQ
jgi:hypothetical protein